MENEKQLSESVRGLTEQIRNSNSLWRNFLRGVLFGLGSAIGASVIAAVIIGSIIKITRFFPGLAEMLNMVK